MIYLQTPRLDKFTPCPYLPDRQSRIEYFFAAELSRQEFDAFLSTGWRRFGYFFFRPDCGRCRECIPLRIRTGDFSPSRSQRRVLRRNRETTVRFRELNYRDEIYEIYTEHSRDRFAQEASRENFLQSFYPPAVAAIQSEYYRGEELFAVGYLDIATSGLSSVYFIYKTASLASSPGTFSVLKEIELAEESGLDYYYLGYYIRDNRSMAYKKRFGPHELYDWKSRCWRSPGEAE